MDVFDLLKKYNIEPRRSAGQNFLIDQDILKKIVETADLKQRDNVLEVGPGLGVLTEQLVKNAKKVVAVELDRSLFFILKKIFKAEKNLELLNEDILELDSARLANLFSREPYKIVANIPYNITASFLRKFLEIDYPPQEMILMVQKEVAQRICAQPGELSLLGVSVQFYSKPQIIHYVPKSCFFPKPEVDSAIIRVILKKQKLKPDEVKQFFRLVKIGFSAKRKQLQNNLTNGLHCDRDAMKDLVKKLGLKETVRAQELSLEEWRSLVKEIVM
jgi:16S rRNA (adenine1518-N6/adenine1519-N6)-dimethyltransferase